MMKALERVTPESVGLRSEDVLEYIENLEITSTEMHGIMLARDGKVFCEGWWDPYSPVIHHADQSLTKTYTTTAIGMLVDEGKLHLDDKMCDLLKDYFPDDAPELAKKMTLKHVLTMHSGVDEITFATSPTWIEDFFRAIKVEPGSKWCYSGMCTAMLGAVVRAVSGQDMMQFLKPRLFDKIGIDSSNIKWFEHRDGFQYCGGGLFTTTEDNLRLGLLYLNKGEFDGQRIVSEQWVHEATRKQVTNPLETDGSENTCDENSGYGYQVWISHVPGNFLFWGALGQYIQCIPGKNMCCCMHQFIEGPEGIAVTDEEYRVFDYGWGLADKVADHPLPENPKAYAKLLKKMNSLSLDRRPCAPVPPEALINNGKKLHIAENTLSITPSVNGDDRKYGVCVSYKLPKYISEISVESIGKELNVHAVVGGKQFNFVAGLDGVYRSTYLDLPHDLPNQILCQAIWKDKDTVRIFMRYIETCHEDIWEVHFGDNPSLFVQEFSLFSPDGLIHETFEAEYI